MEDHTTTILDWRSAPTLKSIQELRQSLWLTTMELEATRVSLQEQIKTKDDQLNQLKHLLNHAINERNKARNKCQSLVLDNLLPQQQLFEEEPIANCGFSSSDCEESIVSSPDPVQLPETGKFLEAVMKAGPLLQNILLAGPLPDWRNPPPPLDIYQIPSPPLVILNVTDNCFEINKKRRFSEDSDSSTETIYQRITLN